MIEVNHYNVDGNTVVGNEIYGLPQPRCHYHHQIMGSRLTETQCQLLHWCHLDLIGLEAPGIHTMASAIGS